MATPNRWAIRDAGKATFFDLVTKKPIVTLDTLKTTGVETTGETVYARGGHGNAKVVGFSSNREARLSLQDCVFDNNAVAMLTGNNLATGKKTVDRHEIKSIISNKFMLDKTPKGAILGVFKLNSDGTNGQEYTLGNPTTNALEYSVNGKELTFHSSVANDTQFRVYYQFETDTTAKTVKVTSDKFGGTFRVVIDVLVRDVETKADYKGQLIVPNAKFEDNFTINLAADGDPAVLDLNMEILKAPAGTDMWELVIFDESLAV
jgi:hypothetical protein